MFKVGLNRKNSMLSRALAPRGTEAALRLALERKRFFENRVPLLLPGRIGGVRLDGKDLQRQLLKPDRGGP